MSGSRIFGVVSGDIECYAHLSRRPCTATTKMILTVLSDDRWKVNYNKHACCSPLSLSNLFARLWRGFDGPHSAPLTNRGRAIVVVVVAGQNQSMCYSILQERSTYFIPTVARRGNAGHLDITTKCVGDYGRRGTRKTATAHMRPWVVDTRDNGWWGCHPKT